MIGGPKRAFLVVCTDERKPLFEEALREFEFRQVTSVMGAVRDCVSHPAMAVLLDLASTLHAGVAETAPLYDLGIDLPILRCTGSQVDALVAMCQAPFKRMPLGDALGEIASGDPSWRNPASPRRFVRVRRNIRVQYRRSGTVEWLRANAQSISISGLFLLTLDPPPIGTDIDIRILDAGDHMELSGSVVWVHHWEDGSHLPGCGVNFAIDLVPPHMGELLADWYFQKNG
ncbi:MAG TPA: PilZ domain-containing protein [Fibrobacteria bacterium]|nr:PilZ domain-containing protein [Fibrobacteria bacterium]HOX51677.1 PilZ domain-containing protein [Fibrobacteria bacterium]